MSTSLRVGTRTNCRARLGLVVVAGLLAHIPVNVVWAVDTQPPAVPTGLLVLSLSKTMLQARWNPATDDVGVAGYRLDVATDAAFTALVPAYQDKDVGKAVMLKITGLVPSTAYYVRVRAYDAAGNVSASSASGDGRTKSVVTLPTADWVKTGTLHWSAASGDTFNPDDSADFDNSFGEHNGAQSNYRSDLVAPEYLFIQNQSDSIQFDMNTPAAGTYTFTTLIGTSSGYPVRVSYRVNGTWVDLSPDATSPTTYWSEHQYAWNVTIPAAQATTRFRIMVTGQSGTRRIEWAVLKQQIANPFTAPPTDGVHPRLLFTSAEVAELQTRVQSGLSAYLYSQLLSQARGMNPSDATWNSLDSSYESHDAARALLVTSLAAALSQEAALKTKAISFLSRINAWPKWMVVEPLEEANILSAYAIAYDTLYNNLSAAERQTYAARIGAESDLVDTAARVGGFWPVDSRSNNWRAVILSALGLGGLVLDHHVAGPGYVAYATDQMVIHLDTLFDPFGGYGEPMSYYVYANERTIEFASALRRAGGFDLFAYHHGVFGTAIPWILQMMNADHSMELPAGDTNRDPMAAWMIAALMHEYNSGLMRWTFDTLYPTQASLDVTVNNWRSRALYQTVLFYTDGIASAEPDKTLPSSQVYEGVPGAFGYVFFRTAYANPKALYVATECGDDQGFHGHADHGSIFFNAYGQNLVDDFPNGDYGSAEYQWNAGDTGHNAVLIDGKGQADENDQYVDLCDNLTWITSMSDVSFVSMDASKAYAHNRYNPVSKALRHLMLVKTDTDRGYVVVIDDVTKDGAAHTYELRYHGLASAVNFTTVGPGHYQEQAPNANLDVFVADPSPTAISGTVSTQYGIEYLRLTAAQNRGVFVNLLYPTSAALGVSLPAVTTIRTGTLSGFQLKDDTVLFNRAGGLQSAANVQSDGEVLFVRGSTAADELLATKVSTLSYNGVEYVHAPQAVASIAVTYNSAGAVAEVDMGAATSLTLHIAAAPEQVRFNGQSVSFTYGGGSLTVNNLSGHGMLLIGASGTVPTAPVLKSAEIVG